MTTDWKNEHANKASASIKHELVEGVIEEYLDNLGIEDKGLPAYGIRKVARYAAMVARADALGFDPNLLRMTNEEATSHQLDLAARAVLAGVPVYMLDSLESSDLVPCTNSRCEDAAHYPEGQGGWRVGNHMVPKPTEPCRKQYPEVGHEDEGYSCSTHNHAWHECPHRSPDQDQQDRSQ